MLLNPTHSCRCRQSRASTAGFSFVEAIFTIAIIGIMSSLVVAAISNASRDAHRVMARQQQATLQGAVTAWVMAQMRDSSGRYRSLESVRATYNAQPTTKAKFLKLIAPDLTSPDPNVRVGFIDQVTAEHFNIYSTSSDRLQSAALDNVRQYLTLPPWEKEEFPRVDMVDVQ